jgi:probable F420-dependent oxidoreductase
VSVEPGGGRVEGVLPYWLDRPDEEALEIALEVERAGLDALWIGELMTFDSVALATAIGDRTERLRLTLGPLASGVRSPASLAFAVSSISRLTGSRVDLALGASSPVIVSGWHDRPWEHAAPRMRETVEALRPILAGERTWYEGDHVRVHGFRLRRPAPETRICVAAFGPEMTRVAARHADQVVLNLVPPEHIGEARASIDREAERVGRTPPPLAVWVPVAVDPGAQARLQLASQLAIYLAPPGYGEMFSRLGFGALVEQARGGAKRDELAARVPFELLEQVCAVGSASDVAARLASYHGAGAELVGVVPSTAEDPGGRIALSVAAGARSRSTSS